MAGCARLQCQVDDLKIYVAHSSTSHHMIQDYVSISHDQICPQSAYLHLLIMHSANRDTSARSSQPMSMVPPSLAVGNGSDSQSCLVLAFAVPAAELAADIEQKKLLAKVHLALGGVSLSSYMLPLISIPLQLYDTMIIYCWMGIVWFSGSSAICVLLVFQQLSNMCPLANISGIATINGGPLICACGAGRCQ